MTESGKSEKDIAKIKNESDSKLNLRVLKRMIGYASFLFPTILLTTFLACISSVIIIWCTEKASNVVDMISDMITSGNSEEIIAIRSTCIIIIILYLLYALFHSAQDIIVNTIDRKIRYKLSDNLETKRQKLSIGKTRSLVTGDLISILTNDIDKISDSFCNITVNLLPAIVLLVGTLIMMILQNVLMTVIILVSCLLGMGILFFIMSMSQKYFDKQQTTLGNINGYIEEVLSGSVIVKSFSGEKIEKKKFEELNGEMRNVSFKTFFFQSVMLPLSTLVNNFGYISICITGAILIINGEITFGVIAAFIMYLVNLQETISIVFSTSSDMQALMASSERFFEFIDLEEMPNEDHKIKRLENIVGNIEFQKVRFGYDPDDRIIINDFNLKVRSGQSVAIVGHTGAGKTTLINLLLRYYEVDSGTITIDGIPISEIPKEHLREQFSVVPQDTWIFNGTLRENLTMGKYDVSDEYIGRVCKEIGLSHFISTLTDGYDTILDEKIEMSYGQKQQISIARAMLSNNSILILDEATSSVDVILEQKIQKAMDALIEGKTSFIIAHRLSTIENADIILVMKDGNVVESGQHNELLLKGGAYADYYYSQFKFEDGIDE